MERPDPHPPPKRVFRIQHQKESLDEHGEVQALPRHHKSMGGQMVRLLRGDKQGLIQIVAL